MDKGKTKSRVELYHLARKFLQEMRLSFCCYPVLTSKTLQPWDMLVSYSVRHFPPDIT